MNPHFKQERGFGRVGFKPFTPHILGPLRRNGKEVSKGAVVDPAVSIHALHGVGLARAGLTVAQKGGEEKVRGADRMGDQRREGAFKLQWGKKKTNLTWPYAKITTS